MTVPAAKDLAETLLADLGQSFTLPAVDLSGAAFQLPVLRRLSWRLPMPKP